MKLQFFIGTIWGVTQILQGGGVYATKTALLSIYFSSRLCLNVTSDSEGAKTYESKRHSIEMVIQEKEGEV